MTSRRGVLLPENVNKVKRLSRGKFVGYYYYYRPNGARIKADPTDRAAFLKAYEAAKGKAAEANERSFGALVTAYLKSPEFDRNSDGERAHQRKTLDMLRERFDWVEVGDLSNPQAQRELIQDFYEWRDSMRKTPRQADARVAVLKRLLNWGKARGHLSVNIATGIERLVPSGHSRKEKVWTPAQEARFLSHAPLDVAQVYLGALYTVQRRSDVAKAEWEHIADGWLRVEQDKTGAIVYLPLDAFPPLAELVAALPFREGKMFRTRLGNDWTGSNINLRFRNTMRAAGMADLDLTFHDLRGTALSRLALAGCTEAERAALSGHSLGSKLGDYTAADRRLAEAAYRKWWAFLQSEAAK